MKYLAVLLLSGCTTVGYWEKNPNVPVFDDADIHFVRVSSKQFPDHCGNFAIACAVRCVTIHPEAAKPACVTGFANLQNRWRCVIVSTYTLEQLELIVDRNGMPAIPHEIRHCKGEDHGF